MRKRKECTRDSYVALSSLACEEASSKHFFQCQGFTDVLDACGEGKSFVMKVTGSNADTITQGTDEDGDTNKLKPDLILYPNTQEVRELVTLSNSDKRSGEDVRVLFSDGVC